MKGFLDSLLVAALLVGCVLIAAVVGVVAYLWFYGIVIGLEHLTSLPIIVGVVLVLAIVLMFGAPATIAFGLFGIWSGITVIGWPWYGAIALYLPTIAFYIVLITLSMTVGALGVIIGKMIDDFTPPWRKRR